MKTFIGIFLCILVHVQADVWKVSTFEMTTSNEEVINVEHDEEYNGTNSYLIMIKESLDDETYGVNITSVFEYNGEFSEKLEGFICINDTVTNIGSISSIVRTSLGVECPIALGNYSVPGVFDINIIIPGAAEIAGGQIPRDFVYLHTRALNISYGQEIFRAIYELKKI